MAAYTESKLLFDSLFRVTPLLTLFTILPILRSTLFLALRRGVGLLLKANSKNVCFYSNIRCSGS